MLRSAMRHQSVFFLVLRRMRMPLILLVTSMAISVLGLTLVPGIGEDGEPRRLGFFEAFYFVSYTATTIGFGEVPYSFSPQQRLWVIITIYLSVVGWTYTLGTLIGLLSDRNLRHAFALERFARAVRHLREPFYLVCGYGETGRLICRALDQMGRRAVVVEIDETRMAEIDLHEHRADIPAVCADAGRPEILRLAGLIHRDCAGVIALTNDDHTNLAIAISARLLATHVPALCRAERREVAANMASFGTRHIINPFERFGETLGLALRTPSAWMLLRWLTGFRYSRHTTDSVPPRGRWIVCGHGRFAAGLIDVMDDEALEITIIDPDPPDEIDHRWVVGDATGEVTLLRAGVREADGIIAGTNSDLDNLSIVVTARELNPALFVIARQNRYANRDLFTVLNAEISVVPSEVIANECLSILATPLFLPFKLAVRAASEPWCAHQLDRLTRLIGEERPDIWGVTIDAAQAEALTRWLAEGREVRIGDLLLAPARRDSALRCAVLYLKRADGEALLVPADDTPLRRGDELLLASAAGCRSELELSMANEHTLTYVLTGEEVAGGRLWQMLGGKRKTLAADRR
ncbi:MAG: potassium channel protein [Thauera phenolivorans]|uniref:Potassium channel protein n=2 Tax=Thauera phenolivorans TaxID=1792543 RepID=A0A7X7R6P5_9RHOO|nr:potassium channel protein [Thauera phenolivorans]